MVEPAAGRLRKEMGFPRSVETVSESETVKEIALNAGRVAAYRAGKASLAGSIGASPG